MIELKGKKILIISPHPDDETIGCGGLISKCKKEGSSVFVFYIAVGSSKQLSSGSIEGAERLKECEAVSKFCNFKYEILFIGKNFETLDHIAQRDIINPIEKAIEDFKPDIVCIPFQSSYNQDHRSVFTACITALRPVPKTMRHMPALILECEEPHLWSVSDNPFKPNFFVELTEEMIKDKVEAMKLHKSQNRGDPFSRSPENLKRLAELRGKEIGTNLAEGFRNIRFFI